MEKSWKSILNPIPTNPLEQVTGLMRQSSDISRRILWTILVVGISVRIAAMILLSDSLVNDRDGYLGLGERIALGEGMIREDSGAPTAFRPPLLPLALAVGRQACAPAFTVAAVNLLATLGIFWATFRLEHRLFRDQDSWRTAFVMGVIAVDPLLILYSTQPMTEILATWLMLMTIERFFAMREHARVGGCLDLGFCSGLLVLCRPVFWPLVLFGFMLQVLDIRRHAGKCWKYPVASLVAFSVLVSAWVLRNHRELGTAVLTTTHGGYTLLLGNNEVFDREVVSQSWGRVWPQDSLTAWQRDLVQTYRDEGIPEDEVSVDRWMQIRAEDWIAGNPQQFLRGAWLKLRRFWAVVPLGPARSGLSNVVLGLLGLYGLVLYGFVLHATYRGRMGWRIFGLLIVVAGSLSMIHSVYWSNARFRAPVVPLLAIAAATSIRPPRDPSDPC